MTRYGFRSNATVTAPSGTCATVPAAAIASTWAMRRSTPATR